MCLLPWSHEMCPLVCFVVSFRIFVLLWNQSVSVAKHPLHVRRSLPTQCLVWIDPQRCNLALMEKRPICILICIYIYIYVHMFHAFMYPRNHCITLLPDVSWTPLSCDLKAQWFQGEKWRITSQLTYFYCTEMLENICHCCHFDIS